jgi:hypothetical protein
MGYGTGNYPYQGGMGYGTGNYPYGSYSQGGYGGYGMGMGHGGYGMGYGQHRLDERNFGRFDEPHWMTHGMYGSQGYWHPLQNLMYGNQMPYGNQMFDRGSWDDRNRWSLDDRNRWFQGGNLNEMRDTQDRWRRQMGMGMPMMGNVGGWYDENYGGMHVGKGPRGYRRPDERIREEISDALTRHPNVDATNIDVKVIDAEVTLAGAVEDRFQKRMAEMLAERIEGVRDVHNQIKVQRSNVESTNNMTGTTTTTTGRGRSSSSSAS